MSSLHYLLTSSAEQVAADRVSETMIDISRELPATVGFTRLPSGVWAGQQVIREAPPNGDIRIYDPNDHGGDFAQFERYDHETGLYVGANLPQTQEAMSELAILATLDYGRVGHTTRVNLIDLENSEPFGRKVAAVTAMQDLVRCVLNWYDVRL